MSVKDRILTFFNMNPSLEVKDMIEFRQGKIDLLKGDIDDIIDQIDQNEESYLEMKKSTSDQIEKGMKDGDSLLGHISERYARKNTELLKSLGSKKIDLKKQEDKVIKLIEDEEEKKKKSKPSKNYGDSIVRDDKGNILMLLRKSDEDFEPNKWGLPGGKVEKGEDDKEGAIRELKEESNLTALNCSKALIKMLPDGKITYYNVTVEENTDWVSLDNDEHSNYCFMSLNEIKKRPSTDFILDLKHTLLKIVDPIYDHHVIIEKAHESGQLDEESFNKADSAYRKFTFSSEELEEKDIRI